jgi:hypothetical protein
MRVKNSGVTSDSVFPWLSLLVVESSVVLQEGNSKATPLLNHLKPRREREREREKIKCGVAEIGTTFNGGNINLDLRLRRSPGSARSSFW